MTMCVAFDAEAPIAPIAGAAADTRDLTLESADGTRFAAFAAYPDEPRGPAVLVLPDVRGLFRFYEELALRFAEHGFDSIAIDYFGRTAGTEKRGEDFPFRDHLPGTSPRTVADDAAAAIAQLRARGGPGRPVFTIGFCFGGTHSWLLSGSDLGLAGVIGFYGQPIRFALGSDPTPPIEQVHTFQTPLLALMGGDDPGIPQDDVNAYERALQNAGVAAEVVTYPGAPHSFFDRRQADYAEAAADAWERVLRFIEAHP